MSYKQPFSQRAIVMGDIAESAFKRWAARRSVRCYDYGIHRPGFKQFKDIPAMIRATPDFLCEGMITGEHFLVEAKGMRGPVIRSVKVSTMEDLRSWNDSLSVYFFIYDSSKKRTAFISYEDMEKLVKDVPIKAFENDGNRYYEIPAKLLTWDKEELDEQGQPVGY